jgi:Tol biopolymer transport system component
VAGSPILTSLFAALVLAFVAFLGTRAPPVQATFSGVNGRIAFTAGPSGPTASSINPDGTALGAIAVGRDPSWSSDGARIVFALPARPAVFGPYLAEKGIAVANADGTNFRKLTDAGAEPAWSPDGARIAFSLNRDIYVVGANGGTPTKLTTDPLQEGSPAWSPNGQKIAYIRSEPLRGGQVPSEIWTINPDGGGVAQVTSYPVVSGFAQGADAEPSWSPDGSRLVFTHVSGSPGYAGAPLDVQAINADGGGRVTLYRGTVPGVTPGATTPSSPVWSPNGRQIAFARQQLQPLGYIHVMNADGSDVRQITHDVVAADLDWGSSTVVPPPLRVALSGPRRQRLDGHNRIYALARCSKDCLLGVSASVRTGGRRIRSDKRRAGKRLFLRAGKAEKLHAKFLRGPARAIRKILSRNRRPVAKLEVIATELAGSSERKLVRSIKLRYP